MGGFNSGRYGGRPTVEGGLTLDLYRLIRDGSFAPGGSRRGSIVWSNSATGKKAVASIGFEAELGETRGRVLLQYMTTDHWSGQKRESDYWLELTTTQQPFGGRRWWWVCPRTGQLAAKLHLPNGAVTFASRRAYRLGYRSQRESRRDRALTQAFQLRCRLGSDGRIGDYIAKPNGMRWRTYERLMARCRQYEGVTNQFLVEWLRRTTSKKAQRRSARGQSQNPKTQSEGDPATEI
jgi:hypothetical protein